MFFNKNVLTEKPKDAGNQILSVLILAPNHKRQLLQPIKVVYFILVSLKFSIIWLMPWFLLHIYPAVFASQFGLPGLPKRENMQYLDSFNLHSSCGSYYQLIKQHHKFLLEYHKSEMCTLSVKVVLASFVAQLAGPTWNHGKITNSILPVRHLSQDIHPTNIHFFSTYLKDFLISSAWIVSRISWYSWRSSVAEDVAFGGHFLCA